jgi:type VII secretion integral membrane protein EccD
LLGGFGAVALAWPAAGTATTGRGAVGTFLALASTAGAVVARRLHGDPLICMTLSLVAVVYAGALGFLTGRSGTTVSGLVLASAAMFSAAILLLRVTDCGRTSLSAVAASSALISAATAASVAWGLQPSAGGAALAALSLAMLGLAPRLSMAFSGTTPEAAPNVRRCHHILTGLVWGSSITAALGAAAAALGDGSGLRGTVFSGIIALVLLLRVRTHVDASRRSGLAVAAVLSAIACFAAAAAALPAYVQMTSALAAIIGVAALGCIVRPTVSPIVLRTVEVIEYVALASVIPMTCWLGGIYGWARGMNLL